MKKYNDEIQGFKKYEQLEDGTFAERVQIQDELEVKKENETMESGVVFSNGHLDIEATGKNRAAYIAVKVEDNKSVQGHTLEFEHFVTGIGWLPWLDGYGDPVELILQQSAVYGPFQGFPLFERGRVKINSHDIGENKSVGKVYIQNPEAESNGSSPELAFNEVKTLASNSWRGLPRHGSWVGVDMGAAQEINTLQMWGRDGTSTLREFRLEGSDNASDWTEIITGELNRDDSYQNMSFDTKNYRYYRIYVESNHGATGDTRLHDVRLYHSDITKFDVQVQGVL